MADMKQVHKFAIKWFKKFRDPNINYIELVDHWMADDCEELGFKMDCGKAFSKKYGQAVHDYRELERIINDITDIALLGSAIYSQWRYFNHWAYDAAEILKPENREWFILALTRLDMLTEVNSLMFQGTLKKVRIVSNNICYGPMPQPDDEVEQRLTINCDGRVWFSGYNLGSSREQFQRARTKNYKIEKTLADNLLNALADHFGNEYYETFSTDVGEWVMEMTNTEGTTYKFSGSLCADFDYHGTDLSDLVRDTLGMEDLYVFDGNNKPDIINRITLDYHRLTKIKPKAKADGAILGQIIWNYTEQLIIDRQTETIEHTQNIGTGCKVSRKYEIKDGIKNLLDYFDAENLFSHIKGDPDDVVENPNETRNYKITIDYKKNPQRVIEGSFDKNGLPDDFRDFVCEVYNFISLYGIGEILNPSVYGKVKRRKSEYIFCSVYFESGYKTYYYLTDDDSIRVGDYVIVPAGKDNHKSIARVEEIEYFNEENVPFPVEKTKKIIRKCTDEDFEKMEGM